MEEQLNKPNINVNDENQEEDLNIMELLSVCLARWKWFAISVFICLCIGGLHILRSVPTYTRSASLLIKDDKRGGGISNDVSDAFASMGLSSARNNVNNELYTISSPAMVLSVVKRLNLDINYRTKGFFRDTLKYGTSLPVKVSLPDIMDS